jgi:hypothetical protein
LISLLVPDCQSFAFARFPDGSVVVLWYELPFTQIWTGIFQETEPPSKKSSPSPQADQVRENFRHKRHKRHKKEDFFGSVTGNGSLLEKTSFESKSSDSTLSYLCLSVRFEERIVLSEFLYVRFTPIVVKISSKLAGSPLCRSPGCVTEPPVSAKRLPTDRGGTGRCHAGFAFPEVPAPPCCDSARAYSHPSAEN